MPHIVDEGPGGASGAHTLTCETWHSPVGY